MNKKQWASKEELLDLIAIAQSCPGVFAINIATFIGYKLRKTRGAIATTIGTALPSFLIILAIAIFFGAFKDNPVIAVAMFRGNPSGRRFRSLSCLPSVWRSRQRLMEQFLDSTVPGSAHLAPWRLTYLYHTRGRPRRLPLRHVHQTDRIMIFLDLFFTFFKIGLFGFGGGYGMLSLIQHETVESHHWSTSEFTDIVAISQMTPGPIGINSATYCGYTAVQCPLRQRHVCSRSHRDVWLGAAIAHPNDS